MSVQQSLDRTTDAFAPPRQVREPAECLNCGTALTGDYCAECGQKRLRTDLSLREFATEAAQELTQWDGKVPRTLKALFLSPGLLTRDALAGRRARWLPPLRLYLLCSLAYFLSGPMVEVVTHRAAREMAKITITNSDGSKGLTPEVRKEIAQGTPARIFGAERLERAAANSAQLNSIINSMYPRAMFVLLPIFALLTRLAWRRKVPWYPAHLYVALHLHAAWFGALAVSTVLGALLVSQVAEIVIGVAALVYVVWYALVALHRIFEDSWGRTIAKAAAVTVVYCLCLFTVSLAMLGYAVMTM